MTPRARRLLWLGGWLALSAALVVAARGLPLGSVARELSTVRPGWIAVAVLCGLIVLPLWTAEWVRLAPGRERPRFGTTLEVVALTSTTLNTVPFFAGEAAGVVLLVGRAGLSRGAALGVLALDQLLVGVAKLVAIAAAAAFAPVPAWVRAGVTALAVGVGVALVVLAAVAGSTTTHEAGTELRPVLLARLVAGARRHLDLARDPARIAAVVTIALLKKSAEVGAALAVQQALGVDLPWWSGIVVVAALGVGTLLPIAPANLGTYEATAFLAYRSLGVAPETAIALGAVQHVCALAAGTLPGYLLLSARSLGLMPPVAPSTKDASAPAPASSIPT